MFALKEIIVSSEKNISDMFYRTQSKIAIELIIEHPKLFFSSFVHFTYIFFQHHIYILTE